MTTAPATAAECESALAEFRAQRELLDRAHGAARRMRSEQLAGARPTAWSTTTAGAYADRLDELGATLDAAAVALDEAIRRVEAAMADVAADLPVALAAGSSLR